MLVIQKITASIKLPLKWVFCFLYFVFFSFKQFAIQNEKKRELIRTEIIFHAFQSKIVTIVAIFRQRSRKKRRLQLKLHLIRYKRKRTGKKIKTSLQVFENIVSVLH